MIISDEVEIVTIGSIIKYYRDLGYPAEHKKVLKVKVSDLTKSSECLVEVSCDICSIKSEISYSRHNKSVKKYNIYCCNKCKGFKSRMTCLDKYGVENVSQLQDIKIKKENTCINNYGVKNPSNSKEVIEKIKNTFLQRYETECALQNEEFYSKFKSTMMSKFGANHALKNQSLIEKSKQTCISNHGCDHPSKSFKIQEKSKLTRIENKTQIPESLMTDWEIYKKLVKIETRKNKKILLENWDGYDFYDKEYIKDNYINFKPRDGKYPSLDHKVSVFFGFINNIPYSEIGSLENICITKTEINCSKREKNYLK
jgi:hypothetical protein